jgi:hypothetical protein
VTQNTSTTAGAAGWHAALAPNGVPRMRSFERNRLPIPDRSPPPGYARPPPNRDRVLFVKIFLVAATIAVLMVVANDQHWSQRAGLTGSCWEVQRPAGQQQGTWYACKEGVLTGLPNLEPQQCSSAGMVAKDELWQCIVPLVSVPGY